MRYLHEKRVLKWEISQGIFHKQVFVCLVMKVHLNLLLYNIAYIFGYISAMSHFCGEIVKMIVKLKRLYKFVVFFWKWGILYDCLNGAWIKAGLLGRGWPWRSPSLAAGFFHAGFWQLVRWELRRHVLATYLSASHSAARKSPDSSAPARDQIFRPPALCVR